MKGVSFSVKRGELFAFLGTNGAGKSTTIDILCTLIKKTSGKVVIDGYTLGEGKRIIISAKRSELFSKRAFWMND